MDPRARRLAEILERRLRGRLDPRVKGSVARRLAQRVALGVLANRFSAWEPLHERAARLASEAEAMPEEHLHRLFEELCGVLLVGYVVPLPQVLAEIREARDWQLGLCVCRQAERVRDLRDPDSGRVLLAGPEEACRPWLLRLLDAFEGLRGRDAVTEPAFRDLLERLSTLRKVEDPRCNTAAFFEACWPRFEILLDHPRYAPEWRETMRRNRRSWRVHPELLCAWAELCWYARGAVFTSMAAVDARYTICTCPGPELDGGCLLFNWAYGSGNPHVVAPHPAGQRRDAKGNPLPCERFPARAVLPCLGCGCDHDDPDRAPGEGLPDPRPRAALATSQARR